MENHGNIVIKFSESELECLCNSLYMTSSLKVPTQENGEWKKPYKNLLKEVEGIKYKFREEKRKRQNEPNKSYQNPEKCESCND